MKRCLLDTGPIVALLVRSEPEHDRVRERMRKLRMHLITTGAVVTEAFYFMAELSDGPITLCSFLEAAAVQVYDAFTVEGLAGASGLMKKYRNVPMDFPDATLIRAAEQTGTDQILTMDRRGFSSFRFAGTRRFKLVLDSD